MNISLLTVLGSLRREVRHDAEVNRLDPDPEGYVTRNNRPMKVEAYDITAPPTSSSTTASRANDDAIDGDLGRSIRV